MFAYSGPRYIIRPVLQHRVLEAKARIIQTAWQRSRRRSAITDVESLLAVHKLLYVPAAKNEELFAEVHGETRDDASSLASPRARRLFRYASYSAGQRLEILGRTLCEVQDKVDEEEVNAFQAFRAKRAAEEQRPKFVPIHRQRIHDQACRVIQRRWRVRQRGRVIDWLTATLEAGKGLYQRSETDVPAGGSRAVQLLARAVALSRADPAERMAQIAEQAIKAANYIDSYAEAYAHAEAKRQRVKALPRYTRSELHNSARKLQRTTRGFLRLLHLRNAERQWADATNPIFRRATSAPAVFQSGQAHTLEFGPPPAGLSAPAADDRAPPVPSLVVPHAAVEVPAPVRTTAAAATTAGDSSASMHQTSMHQAAFVAKAREQMGVVAMRSQQAEEAFASLAQVSSDGLDVLIDEGETLVALCKSLLPQSKDAAYHARQVAALHRLLADRNGSGQGQRLDFDAFAELYNAYVLPGLNKALSSSGL